MKVSFVAGVGPIIRDGSSRSFWGDQLGIELEGAAPDYWVSDEDELDGVKAFTLWPLEQAAESCFGSPAWPADIPAPQAWLDLDVESGAAVGEAAGELEALGSDDQPPAESRGIADRHHLHTLDALQSRSRLIVISP